MKKKKCKPEEEYGLIDLSENTDASFDIIDDDMEENFNVIPEDVIKEEDEEEEEEINEEIAKIEKIKKKKELKQHFYVDPKEFDLEIKDFYKNGTISDNLANMVSKISHKLSFARNFINYSYREEMVGDGIVRMMKALLAKKYDHTKANNPFSYFTKIAFNAFRNRIKKEKHIHEAHEKYQEHFDLLSSDYNTITKNKNSRIQPQNY
jgi:hypothetical protein